MSTESPQHYTEYTDDSVRGGVADVGATFAGVLLILTSFMEVLHGISAIADDDLYAAGTQYLYKFNLTVWGTIHVIIGVISFIVAIGILRRSSWAQLAGIVITGFAIISNFAFLPRYPIWSLVIIAFNAFVIWALSVQYRRPGD
jgi:hypothetical protein